MEGGGTRRVSVEVLRMNENTFAARAPGTAQEQKAKKVQCPTKHYSCHVTRPRPLLCARAHLLYATDGRADNNKRRGETTANIGTAMDEVRQAVFFRPFVCARAHVRAQK